MFCLKFFNFRFQIIFSGDKQNPNQTACDFLAANTDDFKITDDVDSTNGEENIGIFFNTYSQYFPFLNI